MSTLQDLNQVLSRKQDILENAAGVEKIKKSGKLTARERVGLLLDDGSFMEQAMLLSDAGVVTGSGTVEGRPVYVVAQDFAVMDGAVGSKQAKKVVKVLELARKTGTPVVLMCDSNGARVGEGAAALEAYADIFAHMARLSGVVPMIAMVLGPCVGAAAMMAELADLDRVLLRELIDRIDVYCGEGRSKRRTQCIIIHYRFVGIIDVPSQQVIPQNTSNNCS